MTRAEWKALHRAARDATRSPAISYRNPRNVARLRLDHGCTWFNVDHVREAGKAANPVAVQPAIIRDRAPTARIAEALAWARYFRARRSYGTEGRARDYLAASSCIDDARAIRLSASPFQRIA